MRFPLVGINLSRSAGKLVYPTTEHLYFDDFLSVRFEIIYHLSFIIIRRTTYIRISAFSLLFRD
jgi:hypothetical protein